MHFITFSGWVGLVVVPVAVVFFVAFLTCFAYTSGDGKEDLRQFRNFLLTFVSIYLVLNGIVYALSIGHEHSEPTASSRQVAAMFGLQSGKAYPLVLGERLGGTAVDVSTSPGIFSAITPVSTKPASMLSVSFTHNNKSYILQLYVSQISFTQNATAPPTVTLYLKKWRQYGGVIYDSQYSGCHFVIHNFFTTCDRHLVSRSGQLTTSVAREGLSSVISDSLDSASITLTPAMYRKVLGD